MSGFDKKSILILEDEPIIALDLEEEMAGAGFRDIQIFGSCVDAKAWLENNKPDVAIIDPGLKDGVCYDIAQSLNESVVPFIVYSGDRQVFESPDSAFRTGKWLCKPSDPADLVGAIKDSLFATGN
jgi:DNA-binding response OmpR family regulator